MYLVLELQQPHPFELNLYADQATGTLVCHIATPEGLVMLMENAMNGVWQVTCSNIPDTDFQQAILAQAPTLVKVTQAVIPIYPLSALIN